MGARFEGESASSKSGLIGKMNDSPLRKNRRNKKMHDGFPHGAYFAALLTFRLTCPLAGSHLRSSTFRLFTLTFETSPSYKNEPRISPQLAVNGVILLFGSIIYFGALK